MLLYSGLRSTDLAAMTAHDLSYHSLQSHVQDDVSYPGKPFAVGLTLEALSAHTVDESGKEAFVTQNPLKLLRKVRPL